MILNQKERDIEEKDRELEKQKKELDSAKEEFKNVEKQKEEAITTRNSAIVVAIVVFVLAVGLAVRQRNKLQKETDLIKVERDQVKAEKEQLERDFGSNKELIEKLQVNVEEKIHRSGNNIKSLVAMVKGIKKNYREKPEITAALDRVFERANKLHNITSYIAAIEEKGDPVKVKSLIDNILKEFKGTIGDFDLDYDFVCNPEIEFVRDKNLNIARIVNEICTNSVKHAFIDFPCENPTIFVKFYLEGDKYNLIIGDNGKGLNQAAAKKSYGAKIIDKCIQALKGEYNIDSNNGTIYNITF
jgi:two-component sensor histidine kinase